ncbi:MAG: helix-turn-helix domain-containing protein [Candidatus Bipolaricaulia bacterium]
MTENKHIGSSFDDFLAEEGIRDEVTEVAIKRVLARHIQQEMAEKGLTKTEMAERMNTSRSSLNRLLDPDNDSVNLKTMSRAAEAIGKRLNVSLEDQVPADQA